MPQGIVCIVPRKMILWSVFGISLVVILCLVAAELKKINSIAHRKLETVDRNEQRHLSSKIGTKHFSKSDRLTRWDLIEMNEAFFDNPNCKIRPFLLILVTSAPQNFHRRSAIRQTWGRASLRDVEGNLSSRTVFLIGRAANSKPLNILVENEQFFSGDLIVGNYYDTYRNLTLKVMHGIRWANYYCQPNYLLKTDDDCFVNVAQLLKFLSHYNPSSSGLYVGYVRKGSKVIRDPSSRWFVSRDEYSEDFYPPYISGIGYLLSKDVIQQLVVSAAKVNLFPNEDAYVGTLLNLSGISPMHSNRFTIHGGPWQLCNFLYLFVIHRVSAEGQKQMQVQSDTALVECPASKIITTWN